MERIQKEPLVEDGWIAPYSPGLKDILPPVVANVGSCKGYQPLSTSSLPYKIRGNRPDSPPSVMSQPFNTGVHCHAPVRPRSFIFLSVFTLLFCCLPIGLAAVVYSVKTRKACSHGRLGEAISYAKMAITLNLIGLVLGILCYILIGLGALGRLGADAVFCSNYHCM